jgi:hypothetical protein
MRRTGIFATIEETTELKKLADEARQTPVIAFSSAHALERGGLSGEAWDLVHHTCHKYALAHGLPEIGGYYGIDCSNREFVTT